MTTIHSNLKLPRAKEMGLLFSHVSFCRYKVLESLTFDRRPRLLKKAERAGGPVVLMALPTPSANLRRKIFTRWIGRNSQACQ